MNTKVKAEDRPIAEPSGYIRAWREAAGQVWASDTEISVPVSTVTPMHNVGVIASSHKGSHEKGGAAFQGEAMALGQGLARDGRLLIHWGASKGLMKIVRREWEYGAGFCSPNPYKQPDTDPKDAITQKQIIFAQSQAVLVMPGGISVIDKLTDALVYNYMEGYKPKGERQLIPVILVNKDNAFSGFDDLIKHMIEQGFCRSQAFGLFTKAQDAQEALKMLKGLEVQQLDSIKPIANLDSVMNADGTIHDLDSKDHGALGLQTYKRLLDEEELPDRRRRITVFTGSSKGIEPIYAKDAFEVGARIQKCGAKLMYGGGRQGSMGAVLDGYSKGISNLEISGGVIPVSMRVFAEHENYPSKRQEILCDDIYDRKRIMTHHSDAMIALPGGLGTLDEILDAIRYNYVCLSIGQIEKMKPVILLNRNKYWQPLVDWLKDKVERKFVEPTIRNTFTMANTPEEAVERALNFETARTKPAFPVPDLD